MSYKGDIGNFDYEKQEDGTFLYKAKENSIPLTSKKTEKPQYKERPQFPVIEEYEQASVKRFQQDLANTVKEIVNFLKNI